MTSPEVPLRDDDLIESLQAGQAPEHLLRILMDRYHDRLYWQVRHIVHIHEDTDDVLQQVWMKVYQHLGRFEGRSSIHTWLYRIAQNEAIGHLRKNKRHTEHFDAELHEQMIERIVADPHFDGDVALASLHAATLKLTDKQRAVFTMRYFQEMSYEEISKIVGTSVGGLKALYHHARKQIERHVRAQVNQSPL